MVFVLDKHKRPLMPCSNRRARILLQRGRAVVHRMMPFTLRLRDRVAEKSVVQPIRMKIDPGSKHSGVALIREEGGDKGTVLHLAQVDHKTNVHKRMGQRAGYRRRRRSVNLRYRPPRFANRHPESCAGCGRNARHGGRFCRQCHTTGHHDTGMHPVSRLAPSLRCRVDNLTSWVNRYRRLAPLASISMELVRFDLQGMENPEIQGTLYQQGTLAGVEVREYLLQKFKHQCAYCEGLSGNPILNLDHIVPRSRDGTDRVSNLALACRSCNEDKGARTPAEWAEHLSASKRALDRKRVEQCGRVQARAKAPLQDAAAVNTTRWVLHRVLLRTNLSIEVGSGGRTKWNRTRLGLPKTHATDAACVGTSTPSMLRLADHRILVITALGRGRYQRTKVNASGFPVGYLMRTKDAHGFRSSDLVEAAVQVRPKRADLPAGLKQGWAFLQAQVLCRARVIVRACGAFRVGPFDGVSWKAVRLLQRADGYGYRYDTMPLAASPGP